MATNYSQIGYGSKGSDVKTLQELLNSNGYTLDVDGVFGSKTQAAVKDYQEKNGLSVDGIVGKNTWGTLTSASTGTSTGGSTSNAGAAATGTSAAKTSATTSAADMSFSYDDYQESDTVKQAYALLQQQMANQPGAYSSQWQDQINALIDQITNREDFSYDLNADALYQQYADQYTTQGKLAMMDTMGQAQTMTGGYGNSYAQSVGQQTYQGYLQQLNDVVPELYQMALDQYNQEGTDLYNQYSLLGTQEEQDYNRYRDTVSDYYSQLQQAYDQYNTERDYDYSKYADERDFSYGTFADDRSYAYQNERDAVSDEQWLKEYEESIRQYDTSFAEQQRQYDSSLAEEQRQYDQNYALSTSRSTGSTSSGSTGSSTSGGSSGSSGGSYDNGSLSSAQVKALQEALGVDADGKYGTKSKSAAGGLSAEEAYNKYVGSGAAAPGGFTGTTYSEAVAYLKSKGVPTSNAVSFYTADEWERRKNSGATAEAIREFDSYAEYLEYVVDVYVDAYGNG